MLQKDFERSNYDTCVYFRELKDQSYIYLLIYVDDMLIACKELKEIQRLKNSLNSEFHMKDLGPAKRILGMDITRNRKLRTLSISQEGYIRKVVDIFDMRDAKIVSTPIGAHFKLGVVKDDEVELESAHMKNVPYSNATGSIMYSMVSTRPDIAYGLGLVSRFMSKPSREHWQAVKWLLRYLKGSAKLKLMYSGNEQSTCDVVGYCDSDYAADLDKRRSLSGYVFTVGRNVVSWKSSLQHVVALSTTEA